MDQSHNPPPPSSASVTSFPILTITILGILTTAILLVSYYVFVIKCCLYWRRCYLLRRLLSASESATDSQRHHIPPIIHALSAEFRGLEPAVIRSLPIIKFTAAAAEGQSEKKKTTVSAAECAVCLTEFQEEERLKLLPNCSHAFHIDCIDTWLQFNANCPLCRSEITSPAPPLATEQIVVLAPLREHSRQEHSGSILIEVREEGSAGQSSRVEAAPHPSPRKKRKKLHEVESMGDECIDLRVEKDEQFCVHPMRRSISMDSSNDRQLYLSVQEFLRQSHQYCFRDAGGNGEGSSSSSDGGAGGNGEGSGRVRRSFFSFGRSSRTAVLPMAIDV